MNEDLFIEPDGYDQPTVWQRNPKRGRFPTALVVQGEVPPRIWQLLTEAIQEDQ